MPAPRASTSVLLQASQTATPDHMSELRAASLSVQEVEGQAVVTRSKLDVV